MSNMYRAARAEAIFGWVKGLDLTSGQRHILGAMMMGTIYFGSEPPWGVSVSNGEGLDPDVVEWPAGLLAFEVKALEMETFVPGWQLADWCRDALWAGLQQRNND